MLVKRCFLEDLLKQYFFLWSDPYSNPSAKITGKRCNLGGRQSTQVLCWLGLSGEVKYMKAKKKLKIFKLKFKN